MRRGHKLPFGAEIADGGVRFRLWALRARSVELWLDEAAGAGDGSIIQVAMAPEPGGWRSLTTAKAGPGTRYRYAVDGSPFPDPASRAQLDGVQGASAVVDPAADDWRDDAWHVSLGVTAVELMPIAAAPPAAQLAARSAAFHLVPPGAAA